MIGITFLPNFQSTLWEMQIIRFLKEDSAVRVLAPPPAGLQRQQHVKGSEKSVGVWHASPKLRHHVSFCSTHRYILTPR